MQGFINSIEKSGLLTAVTVNSVLLGESGSQGYCRVKVLRVTPGKSNMLCLSPAMQCVQPWNLLFLCFSCQVSSWGGYVFLINLIPLHVLVLMLTGRFSHRIYVAYCTVYCLGTILSMQISFVGFQVGNRRIWRYKDGCSSVGL